MIVRNYIMVRDSQVSRRWSDDVSLSLWMSTIWSWRKDTLRGWNWKMLEVTWQKKSRGWWLPDFLCFRDLLAMDTTAGLLSWLSWPPRWAAAMTLESMTWVLSIIREFNREFSPLVVTWLEKRERIRDWMENSLFQHRKLKLHYSDCGWLRKLVLESEVRLYTYERRRFDGNLPDPIVRSRWRLMIILPSPDFWGCITNARWIPLKTDASRQGKTPRVNCLVYIHMFEYIYIRSCTFAVTTTVIPEMTIVLPAWTSHSTLLI